MKECRANLILSLKKTFQSIEQTVFYIFIFIYFFKAKVNVFVKKNGYVQNRKCDLNNVMYPILSVVPVFKKWYIKE